MKTTDGRLTARLAKIYRESRDASRDPWVKEYAGHLGRAIKAEFDSLPFQVQWCAQDPPASLERLQFEVSAGSLRVFTGGSDSPIFGPATNLYFRAIHDYDHARAGADFSLRGEILAYTVAARRWPWARRILFSEIVLQAADSLQRGAFAPSQKVVIL